MRARVYKTEAVVLRRRKLGEADAILTIYTPRYGKFDVIAKGVRRPKSRMGGHLDLLCRSSLMLAQGMNLDVVTQAQTVEPYRGTRENLEALSAGLYAGELLAGLTPERAEDYRLYALLCDTLERLAGERRDLALRYFEVRLLSELGYEPQLWECAGCGGPLSEDAVYFSVDSGGAMCKECLRGGQPVRPITPAAVKVLRVLQRSGWTEVARLRVEDILAREVAARLRDYVRYVLEREPRSAEFLDTVARLRPEPKPAPAE